MGTTTGKRVLLAVECAVGASGGRGDGFGFVSSGSTAAPEFAAPNAPLVAEGACAGGAGVWTVAVAVAVGAGTGVGRDERGGAAD
ncbi:MAG: hypothetical protein NT059_00200 [Planctomycetota bacterium]|nr:hypothetical protein [Planctomycetota bacterium]